MLKGWQSLRYFQYERFRTLNSPIGSYDLRALKLSKPRVNLLDILLIFLVKLRSTWNAEFCLKIKLKNLNSLHLSYSGDGLLPRPRLYSHSLHTAWGAADERGYIYKVQGRQIIWYKGEDSGIWCGGGHTHTFLGGNSNARYYPVTKEQESIQS